MWKETQNVTRLGRSPPLVRQSMYDGLSSYYTYITAGYFSAVATYSSEEVQPSAELGENWLEIEAKRNCRFFSS